MGKANENDQQNQSLPQRISVSNAGGGARANRLMIAGTQQIAASGMGLDVACATMCRKSVSLGPLWTLMNRGQEDGRTRLTVKSAQSPNSFEPSTKSQKQRLKFGR